MGRTQRRDILRRVQPPFTLAHLSFPGPPRLSSPSSISPPRDPSIHPSFLPSFLPPSTPRSPVLLSLYVGSHDLQREVKHHRRTRARSYNHNYTRAERERENNGANMRWPRFLVAANRSTHVNPIRVSNVAFCQLQRSRLHSRYRQSSLSLSIPFFWNGVVYSSLSEKHSFCQE